MIRSLLRVPLLGKVLGANLALALIALSLHFVLPSGILVSEMAGVLVVSFGITSVLVWLALRPVAELEAVAERVSAGDLSARVPDSPLADRDMLRLAATVNRLLDRVNADRARIQYLAGRSVRARDVEREGIARELRDSLAQTSAAVALQLSAARSLCAQPDASQALSAALESVQQLTEDLRSVAESLYPGAIGEFGLGNAIHALVRRVERRSQLQITVDCDACNLNLPAPVRSALYRVADEALGNTERHGEATHVRITLRKGDGEQVTLEIEDDGRGIDMTLDDPTRSGVGLFSAQAVLALVGGELQISSAPGRGTRVTARVPAGPTSVTQAA